MSGSSIIREVASLILAFLFCFSPPFFSPWQRNGSAGSVCLTSIARAPYFDRRCRSTLFQFGYSAATPGQPVLSLTLQHQAWQNSHWTVSFQLSFTTRTGSDCPDLHTRGACLTTRSIEDCSSVDKQKKADGGFCGDWNTTPRMEAGVLCYFVPLLSQLQHLQL